MKNTAPFGVTMTIEHVFVVLIVVANEVHLFAFGFSQVIPQVALQGRIGFFGAVSVFVPKRGAVGCKGLVKAEVAPAFTSHQIPEPMVEHFVGNGSFGRSVHQFPIGTLRPLSKDHSAGVFHRPRHEIPYRDLVIGRPGIIHP